MGSTWGVSEGSVTCISLHQPWASLLVYGVKRIEGRPWPTEHRGRLWIHATSKLPTPAVIQEVEEEYRRVYAAEGRAPPDFPTTYPTSVVLGCVDVVDCLKAEQVEAWEGLPDSLKMEVGSPYAFLCESPKRLVVPQQMRGHPSLWPLPKLTAKSLEPALKPPRGKVAFTWSKFPMQSGLRTANLRRSANAYKWANTYGEAMERRGSAEDSWESRSGPERGFRDRWSSPDTDARQWDGRANRHQGPSGLASEPYGLASEPRQLSDAELFPALGTASRPAADLFPALGTASRPPAALTPRSVWLASGLGAKAQPSGPPAADLFPALGTGSRPAPAAELFPALGTGSGSAAVTPRSVWLAPPSAIRGAPAPPSAPEPAPAASASPVSPAVAKAAAEPTWAPAALPVRRGMAVLGSIKLPARPSAAPPAAVSTPRSALLELDMPVKAGPVRSALVGDIPKPSTASEGAQTPLGPSAGPGPVRSALVDDVPAAPTTSLGDGQRLPGLSAGPARSALVDDIPAAAGSVEGAQTPLGLSAAPVRSALVGDIPGAPASSDAVREVLQDTAHPRSPPSEVPMPPQALQNAQGVTHPEVPAEPALRSGAAATSGTPAGASVLRSGATDTSGTPGGASLDPRAPGERNSPIAPTGGRRSTPPGFQPLPPCPTPSAVLPPLPVNPTPCSTASVVGPPPPANPKASSLLETGASWADEVEEADESSAQGVGGSPRSLPPTSRASSAVSPDVPGTPASPSCRAPSAVSPAVRAETWRRRDAPADPPEPTAAWGQKGKAGWGNTQPQPKGVETPRAIATSVQQREPNSGPAPRGSQPGVPRLSPRLNVGTVFTTHSASPSEPHSGDRWRPHGSPEGAVKDAQDVPEGGASAAIQGAEENEPPPCPPASRPPHVPDPWEDDEPQGASALLWTPAAGHAAMRLMKQSDGAADSSDADSASSSGNTPSPTQQGSCGAAGDVRRQGSCGAAGDVSGGDSASSSDKVPSPTQQGSCGAAGDNVRQAESASSSGNTPSPTQQGSCGAAGGVSGAVSAPKGALPLQRTSGEATNALRPAGESADVAEEDSAEVAEEAAEVAEGSAEVAEISAEVAEDSADVAEVSADVAAEAAQRPDPFGGVPPEGNHSLACVGSGVAKDCDVQVAIKGSKRSDHLSATEVSIPAACTCSNLTTDNQAETKLSVPHADAKAATAYAQDSTPLASEGKDALGSSGKVYTDDPTPLALEGKDLGESAAKAGLEDPTPLALEGEDLGGSSGEAALKDAPPLASEGKEPGGKPSPGKAALNPKAAEFMPIPQKPSLNPAAESKTVPQKPSLNPAAEFVPSPQKPSLNPAAAPFRAPRGAVPPSHMGPRPGRKPPGVSQVKMHAPPPQEARSFGRYPATGAGYPSADIGGYSANAGGYSAAIGGYSAVPQADTAHAYPSADVVGYTAAPQVVMGYPVDPNMACVHQTLPLGSWEPSAHPPPKLEPAHPTRLPPPGASTRPAHPPGASARPAHPPGASARPAHPRTSGAQAEGPYACQEGPGDSSVRGQPKTLAGGVQTRPAPSARAGSHGTARDASGRIPSHGETPAFTPSISDAGSHVIGRSPDASGRVPSHAGAALFTPRISCEDSHAAKASLHARDRSVCISGDDRRTAKTSLHSRESRVCISGGDRHAAKTPLHTRDSRVCSSGDDRHAAKTLPRSRDSSVCSEPIPPGTPLPAELDQDHPKLVVRRSGCTSDVRSDVSVLSTSICTSEASGDVSGADSCGESSNSAPAMRRPLTRPLKSSTSGSWTPSERGVSSDSGHGPPPVGVPSGGDSATRIALRSTTGAPTLRSEAGDTKVYPLPQIVADIQHSPIIEEVLCAVREQLVAHLPLELARAVADSWPVQTDPWKPSTRTRPEGPPPPAATQSCKPASPLPTAAPSDLPISLGNTRDLPSCVAAPAAPEDVSDVCDFVGSDSDAEDVFHSAPSTPTASHSPFSWPEAGDNAGMEKGTSGRDTSVALVDHAPSGRGPADAVLQVDPMVMWTTPLSSPLERTPVKGSETNRTPQDYSSSVTWPGLASPDYSPSGTHSGPPWSPSGAEGVTSPVAYPRRIARSARTPTGPPITPPRGSATAGAARADTVHASTAVHGGTAQPRGSGEAGSAKAVHGGTAVRGSTAQLLGHAVTAVARTLLFMPDPPKTPAPAISAQGSATQKTLARSGSDSGSSGVLNEMHASACPNEMHAFAEPSKMHSKAASVDSAANKDNNGRTAKGLSGGQQPTGVPAEILDEAELTRKVHKIEKKLREIDSLEKRGKSGVLLDIQATLKLAQKGKWESELAAANAALENLKHAA